MVINDNEDKETEILEIRLQPEAQILIDQIKNKTGYEQDTEVFRVAIRLLNQVVHQIEDKENAIIVYDPDTEKKTELMALLSSREHREEFK